MKELVIATKNPDKKREIIRLLGGLRIKVISLDRYPGCPDVKEGSRSFRENAVRKAMAVSRFTGKPALADDSGLETDALNGRPGVRSSRFAGRGATYAQNNRRLLKMLTGRKAKHRGAQFRCVVAVCDYPRLAGTVEGKIRGRIAFAPKGRYGFGYDPVFIVPRYGKTFAQLGPKIKHRISHRARALKKAKRLIVKYHSCPN
ncbi:MAG: RdgB/HAM1 family non-canonical purine NTP pyrophosphatase [Candidatus Omnitrophica bacterium]|nr:RdgB/HAM1 family non-canonical purine NTP pyrophosphatase [Candidatus Omnitrophota bacterium]